MVFQRRLFADGLYTFFMRVVSMGMAAVLGILTARVLGPHGKGLYALPMVSAGLVTAVFAGLTSATSYFLLRMEGGRGVLRPLFSNAFIFTLLAAGAVVVITYGAHATWATLPAVLSLPGPVAVAIANGYATGTKRIRITTTLALIATGVTIAFMIAAFLTFGRTPSAAIAAWVASSDVIAVAILIWVARDSRRLPPGSVALKEYAWYACRAGAVSLLTLLNYRADIYIVAILTSPQLLGIYTIGVTASETLLAATQVAAVVTSPHVASMEKSAAAQLTARMMRHNILIAGVCSGSLAIFAPIIVKLLYGEAFLPVLPALRILLVGVFALSLGSPLSNFFTLRMGKPEIAFSLASVSAVICIVTSWVLIPRMGLVGAAIGSTSAYLIVQIVAVAYFGIISKISASTMLLPRKSDLLTYVNLVGSLFRKRRIDSAS